MSKTYNIHLVPENGLTTREESKMEFNLGYRFKVLKSTLLSFDRGSYITADDIRTMEREYGLKFNVTFEAMTFAEHMAERDTQGWMK